MIEEEKFIARIKKVSPDINYLTLRYHPESEIYIIRNRGSVGLSQLEYKKHYEYDDLEYRLVFYSGVVKTGDELKIIYKHNGKRCSPSGFYFFGEERLNDVWTKKNKFTGSIFE